MLVKLTERCTMGCNHCMDCATPEGKDMSLDTFRDVLQFIIDKDLAPFGIILSGGEPTEHRQFDEIMRILLDTLKENPFSKIITIATNGENIIKEPEKYLRYIAEVESYGVNLFFQISADVRYYPRRIPTHKRVLRENGFVLCDDCCNTGIYPIGRALENNLPWKSGAPQCTNCLLISAQLKLKKNHVSLHDLIYELSKNGKMCTPHINIDGTIGLGESKLCPPVCSIYDEYETLGEKILNSPCHKCFEIIGLDLNKVKLV